MEFYIWIFCKPAQSLRTRLAAPTTFDCVEVGANLVSAPHQFEMRSNADRIIRAFSVLQILICRAV